ncbi:MAG: formate dehydrogenase accessory sulfurtransferase FdhD [Flavobacteriaceae bacterium]|nr:formate dehydrogenase accessory sulfurtransferase FdhD [Bacteroidia bacterium]NNF83282.1 formate dehydrogenase accessory sulfurtransferase FdhD [Flavobacteriaceae bacterium]NNK69509.1 formate dehydrogenase accessory sulfurtransferase FdhD [Flavobacteriaceae bacterium]NNL79765.1 formate dehydrogenase accessory sulfurtransferase FdhD [Flavobacteriaceae bacterium]
MATRNYEGKKYVSESSEKILDTLTVEEALQIDINNKPFTVSMRTPGNDKCLVRGMLHSEGVLDDSNWHPEMLLKKENNQGVVTIINVNIPEEKLGSGYSNSRSLLSVSSCGICGKTELSDLAFIGRTLDEPEKLNIEIIHELFEKMNSKQFNFRETGGAHAAAAFGIDGALICTYEDIGRHNAVDKVIGKLLLDGNLKQARIMTVSGRISYEIVIKCFKAGIPFLAAVSAPSSLAVDFAKELGITLFAFCREQRATCYSHAYRTISDSKTNKAG